MYHIWLLVVLCNPFLLACFVSIEILIKVDIHLIFILKMLQVHFNFPPGNWE